MWYVSLRCKYSAQRTYCGATTSLHRSPLVKQLSHDLRPVRIRRMSRVVLVCPGLCLYKQSTPQAVGRFLTYRLRYRAASHRLWPPSYGAIRPARIWPATDKPSACHRECQQERRARPVQCTLGQKNNRTARDTGLRCHRASSLVGRDVS